MDRNERRARVKVTMINAIFPGDYVMINKRMLSLVIAVDAHHVHVLWHYGFVGKVMRRHTHHFEIVARAK